MSKKVETALGMGMAVIFVMGVASAVNWPINEFLNSHDLGFMQTVTFILVIASLVQFVEMFLQKMAPSLYEALGVYLPLITTNCAVLGVVLQNAQNSYNFGESLTYGGMPPRRQLRWLRLPWLQRLRRGHRGRQGPGERLLPRRCGSGQRDR